MPSENGTGAGSQELRFIGRVGNLVHKSPKRARGYGKAGLEGGSLTLSLEVDRPELPKKPTQGYRLDDRNRPGDEPTEATIEWDEAAFIAARVAGKSVKVPCETCEQTGNTLKFISSSEDQWDALTEDQQEAYELGKVDCPDCAGNGHTTEDKGGKEPTKAEIAKALKDALKVETEKWKKGVETWAEAERDFQDELDEWNDERQAAADPFRMYAMIGGAVALLGGLQCEVIIRPIETDELPFGEGDQLLLALPETIDG